MNGSSDDLLRKMYNELNSDHVRFREELVSRLPESDVVARVPVARPVNRRVWRTVAQSVVASCLLLAIGVVAFMASRPSPTWAQVQSALVKQKWVFLKYDDGEEFWGSLEDGRQYLKEPGGRIQFFAPGVWQQYLPPGGPVDLPIYGSITEWRATAEQMKKLPTGKPQSAWEFLVGRIEEMEKVRQTNPSHPYRVKRVVESADGGELVRFDIIHINAMDEEELHTQIWVDAKTRLPVRSRKAPLRSAGKPPEEGGFVQGIFLYPNFGPHDIYDFGVPRDAKIVRSESGFDIDSKSPQRPAELTQLLAAAEKSRDQFPPRFRIVKFPAARPKGLDGREFESGGEIDVIYRSGNPVRKESRGQVYLDWTGVRVCQTRYANFSENLPGPHLKLPANVDAVLDWARQKSPMSVYVSDGVRTYTHDLGSALHVRKIDRGPLSTINFPQGCWPSFLFWPYVGMGGSKELVNEPAEAVAGTQLLRISFDSRRIDYYVATMQDQLCVKQVWWIQRNGGWHKEREYELSDLSQLVDGQWSAAKERLRTFDDPLQGTTGYEQEWTLHITVLEEGGFSLDAFDGTKLIEEAKSSGTRIVPE